MKFRGSKGADSLEEMETQAVAKVGTPQDKARDAKKPTASHRVLTAVGIVLCALLIPVLIVNISLIVRSYQDPNNPPSLGGVVPLIVTSDSMYPVIESGDLIICQQANPASVQEGDVISFFDPDNKPDETHVVTHRVVSIDTAEDGTVTFSTKGDANDSDDPTTVPGDKLVGIYQRRIPVLGDVAMFMQTTQGLILCVVVPIVLVVAYDLIRRRLYERGRGAEEEALLAELEELRAAQAANRSGE